MSQQPAKHDVRTAKQLKKNQSLLKRFSSQNESFILIVFTTPSFLEMLPDAVSVFNAQARLVVDSG